MPKSINRDAQVDVGWESRAAAHPDGSTLLRAAPPDRLMQKENQYASITRCHKPINQHYNAKP
jgi:hypothetical protein